jgi:hypothetical protein
MTELKRGQIAIQGTDPSTLTEGAGPDEPPPTPAQQAILRQVGDTLLAYRQALNDLLGGRLAHLKPHLQPYLSAPCNIVALCCDDGAVVRYERTNTQPKLVVGWLRDSITAATNVLSQQLVYCRPSETATPPSDESGVTISIGTTDKDSSTRREVASLRLLFEVVLTFPPVGALFQAKPFCLLSVKNDLEIYLQGQLDPMGPSTSEPRAFLIRSLLRIPVGWECIEVFPFRDVGTWQPTFAPVWAENDVLANVVAATTREEQLRSLDPLSDARKTWSRVLSEFSQLLSSESIQEETLQQFLARYPSLLCPTMTRVWPKLRLGSHVTDFVFQDARGDYLLVELERPSLALFVKDGHPSAEFTHARGQVQDWWRYIEDNLSTIQRELSLAGISTHPHALLVIGRAKDLSSEHRRKLTTLQNEAPSLRVMTYDDIHASATAVIENLLGPLWNLSGRTEVFYLPPGPPPGA